MAGRPGKNTVDFFPHYVEEGKTKFILEQKYGNLGYAVWFKLLEQLGSHEDHYIDCDDPTEWQFLVTKLIGRIRGDYEGIMIGLDDNHNAQNTSKQGIINPEEKLLNDILNLLASVDAINKEYWEKRVIFSENFIKNLSSVYEKRTTKPPISLDIRYEEKPLDLISESEIDKVEYSKVKYIFAVRGLDKIKNEGSSYPITDGIALWNSLVKWRSGKVPLATLKNKLSVERVGLLKSCRGETDKMVEHWNKKKITEDNWRIAINKYIADIINRDPGRDFCNHRFSMQEFVVQSNGYDKYLNR